jgi:hypothetical protein
MTMPCTTDPSLAAAPVCVTCGDPAIRRLVMSGAVSGPWYCEHHWPMQHPTPAPPLADTLTTLAERHEAFAREARLWSWPPALALTETADRLRAVASELRRLAAVETAAREAPVELGDVIAVGEPGCYVVAGHLGIASVAHMLRCLMDTWEEDWEHLGAPYHGWMIVSEPDADGFQQFQERPGPDDGALPYTIVP